MSFGDHVKIPRLSQKDWRAGCIALIVFFLLLVRPMEAQQPTDPACKAGRALVNMPEIESSGVKTKTPGVLRGTLILADEQRRMWGQGTDASCTSRWLRYFYSPDAKYPPGAVQPNRGEPTPGPTLRARVGDWIELAFLNHIDTGHFSFSEDTGKHGCDHTPGTLTWIANRNFFNGSVILPPQSVNPGLYYFEAVQPGTGKTGSSSPAWPQQANNTVTDGTATWKNIGTQHDNSSTYYPLNDSMPNCIHGSSTANLHFHGTHTTPSTTGDNVLIYVRPAMGDPEKKQWVPDGQFVKENFD